MLTDYETCKPNRSTRSISAHALHGGLELSCRPTLCRWRLEPAFNANLVGIAPRAQPFDGRRRRQHIAFGITPPDDLHPDRQTAAEARGDRRRRVAAEIDDIGEAPADQ